jgi:hypothetical protein
MISFAVHTYNEADALDRMIYSIMKIKNEKINEIFIVDHRSSDHTQDVIAKYKDSHPRIEINSYYEEKDFGGESKFTFADLRDFTIRNTKNDYVVLSDSDFIYGPGFDTTIEMACNVFLSNPSMYALTYEIPIIKQHVQFENSRIKSYGEDSYVHPHAARILNKNLGKYMQKYMDGLIEWFYPNDYEYLYFKLDIGSGSVLSIDIKNNDYSKMRNKMNHFQKLIVDNNTSSNFLEYLDEKDDNINEYNHGHDIKKIKLNRDFYYVENKNLTL